MLWKLLSLSQKFNTKFHFNNPLIINFLTWKNLVCKIRWYKKYHLNLFLPGGGRFSTTTIKTQTFTQIKSLPKLSTFNWSLVFSTLPCSALLTLYYFSPILLFSTRLLFTGPLLLSGEIWAAKHRHRKYGNYMAIGDYRVTQTFINNL